jgi:hypothetical protein
MFKTDSLAPPDKQKKTRGITTRPDLFTHTNLIFKRGKEYEYLKESKDALALAWSIYMMGETVFHFDQAQ